MSDRPRKVKLKKTGAVQSTKLETERPARRLSDDEDDNIVLAAPAAAGARKLQVLADSDDDDAGPSISSKAKALETAGRAPKAQKKAVSDDEVLPSSQ
jgi:hypothetical protein